MGRSCLQRASGCCCGNGARRALVFKAPPGWQVAVVFVPLLALYFVSRVSHIVETEGFLMYGLVVATLFSFVGWQGIKAMWFPLVYLLFVLPPPERWWPWSPIRSRSCCPRAR